MFENNLTRFLDGLPESRRRQLRDVTPLPGGRVLVDGRELVDFSSNDYLGLREFRFEDEKASSSSSGNNHHAPACSSRLLAGNHPLFRRIEKRIAELKGTEAALVFGSGFQLNTTVLGTLLSSKLHGRMKNRDSDSAMMTKAAPAVEVFVDRLAHASMHAGMALAGVRQKRFRHNDIMHLRQLLQKSKASSETNGPVARVVVTESLFSMDGDILDIERLRSVAAEFDAVLYVDEAHAVGVCGEKGMGLMAVDRERRSLDPQLKNEILIGTFSKSFTAFGGYVACSRLVKDVLVNACPGLIYSTGLPPSVLNRIERMLELIPEMHERRQQLRKLADRLQAQLAESELGGRRQAMGLSSEMAARQTTLNNAHCSPIIPVVIGDDADTIRIARTLEQSGFLVAAVRPPTVPEGTARLRLSLSAAHTTQDIDALVDALSSMVG